MGAAARALLLLSLALVASGRLPLPLPLPLALPLPPPPAPALPLDAELKRSTPEMAAAAGYPLETHEVLSRDYVLTLHRMPSPHAAAALRPPVLLQHGMLCSSDLWLLAGPQNALAYLLVDAGYDVWLPNARGNTYSRKHRTLNDKMKTFWIFSWHEMGEEDLPRVIDYVLQTTGHEQLLYVGHSMGTTMFYVMLSARPEYARKVRAMVSLAPVAFIKGAPTLLNVLGSVLGHPLWSMIDKLDLNLFSFRKQNLLKWSKLCGDKSPLQPLCIFFYSSVIGKDSAQLNKTRLPLFLTRVQHGVTLRTLSHYNQLLESGEFEAFDEGAEHNLRRYGSTRPPPYDLRRAAVPTALITGQHDAFVPREGVERLMRELPLVMLRAEVAGLNHLDLTWAQDVRRLVNDPVLRLLEAAVSWDQPWRAGSNATRCRSWRQGTQVVGGTKPSPGTNSREETVASRTVDHADRAVK